MFTDSRVEVAQRVEAADQAADHHLQENVGSGELIAEEVQEVHTAYARESGCVSVSVRMCAQCNIMTHQRLLHITSRPVTTQHHHHYQTVPKRQLDTRTQVNLE